jgi:hypothetical protein
LQLCGYIFVDISGVYHRNDLECFLIGDPSAFNHRLFYSQLPCEAGCQFSTSMYEYFFLTYLREFAEEVSELRFIIYNVAADLYYE